MESYRVNKPKFLEFWVKMAKMTLKVTVNDLHFQYQLRVSQNACLKPIWLFSPKSDDELSHRQAEFSRIPRQNGQNDLEGQAKWPLI